jgi:acyl-coenzyme A thioesterase PaaI-like protein
MLDEPHPYFRHEPAPDMPGFHTWDLKQPGLYNDLLGPLYIRKLNSGFAQMRMVPGRRHSNLDNVVHGGTLLGFIDIALFAGAHQYGVDIAGRSSTIELQTHFIGGGIVGEALDCDVELLRETKRLVFLRGTVHQHSGAHLVASFSGMIRKSPAPK